MKTVRFGERTYVGDPFNVVRLYNEKEVDELCVLDIDATADGREPDMGFLSELASECFMPLSYGGGITKISECATLNRVGIEKFVLGSRGKDLQFVQAMCEHFGSQAIVVCVDVVKTGNHYECKFKQGSFAKPTTVMDYCRQLQASGAGEIILQSIDRDGTRCGYDLELISSISKALTIPTVALGGAGEYEHLSKGLGAGAHAVASGSAFTFIGRLRAVLIHYPDQPTIAKICEAAGAR